MIVVDVFGGMFLHAGFVSLLILFLYFVTPHKETHVNCRE